MAFRPWAIVAGDFTPLGGMDRANHALAQYLARSGREVTLIAHCVWPDLQAMDRVRVEIVPRPLGRHMLGRHALAKRGIAIAREIRSRGGIFLANGANCAAGEFNWLHIVHNAYAAPTHGGVLRRFRQRLTHHADCRAERAMLPKCRLVICNSEKTRLEAIRQSGVDEHRTRVVYLGSDPSAYSAATADERAAARHLFNVEPDVLCICFVGQLQNSIKNFDTLYAAIRLLRAAGRKVVLLAAGDDRGGVWRHIVARDELDHAVRILGLRRDVPTLLAASDLLVLPSRYDSYGLAAHEAILRGLPAIVSERAGISERIDGAAAGLLLHDPECVEELAEAIVRCIDARGEWPSHFASVAEKLRAWTWDDMAEEMVKNIETVALAEGGACAS